MADDTLTEPLVPWELEPEPEDKVWVDGIFSAHSDGLLVILRLCERPAWA